MNLIKLKNLLLLLLIFALAIYLRVFNLNFEDYWFDEQVTFFISNPNVNIDETLKRIGEYNNSSDYIFSIILKYFFSIFSYSPEIGRLLPVLFSILSIPAIAILAYQIKKNNGYLIVFFLTSVNFYLISYAQELRVYSFLYFISILSIIFFYILISEKTFLKKLIFSVIYIIISIVGIFSHTFFFIIIFSQLFYTILNNIYYNKKNYIIYFSFSSIAIFFLFFGYKFLLAQLSIQQYWLPSIKIDFFYNYFFSRFFGSKIMGVIYLFTLIYLIIHLKKNIFIISEKIFLLIIILIFSYLLPIIYGLINIPILIDRYIIFVLIPIFLLISLLIIDIPNKNVRLSLAILIFFSSLLNNYIEIFERKNSKPEFRKTLEYIKNSNTKNVAIVSSEKWETSITNYVESRNDFKNYKLKIISLKKINKNIKSIWIICYEAVLINSRCSMPDYEYKNWKEEKTSKYKFISIKLMNRV